MNRETLEIMLEDAITWNKEDRAGLSQRYRDLAEAKKQVRYWIRQCKELESIIKELEYSIEENEVIIKRYKEELAESEV